MEQKQLFQQWVNESKKIVFFGGAGVSTESGIPDFRSVDGLYNQKYAFPPETILSHSFFMRKPDEFYKFYREKMLVTDVQPNAAHLKLAQWEREGRLSAIVTQNIDGLHQKAGSQKVFELHGSIHRNYCMDCGKFFAAEDMQKGSGVPKCGCGGLIKPDVVLYEEGLDGNCIENSVTAISNADLLIVDTAGRLHNKKNLMDEMEKMRRVIDREYPEAMVRCLLVVDSTTGQNGLQQAKAFREAAGINGIVLTKLDGTAKGGIAFPIVKELGVPVMYVGVGEGIEDLQSFNAREFVDALFE